MRLIGYLRVSSESQLEGYGLDSQQLAVVRWANHQRHEIIRTVSDAGVSGATDALDRPGLAEVLQAVMTGEAEGVVVARLDRLARALTVQEATLGLLWRAKGKVFTVDQGEVLQDDPDDPMRTALRQVVGVFSELERRLVTKRLKDGRATKAATGRKAVGTYAFGQRAGGVGRDRDAVDDPGELRTVQRILERRAAGQSYRHIASDLNTDKVPTKLGGSWHAMTVRNIVRRQFSVVGQ
jgi:DNA invertase Pin-like site-specific DNA recombinase